MFLMSLAAWAAALGSLEETVWGAVALPLSMELLCSMLMGDVGLPLGRASRGGGEAACEGGVGEAAWLSVLAIEARRLCVLLGASKLSRGVCFPEETVLPLAGSLDGGELCGWFETAMAATQWSDCQSNRPCGVCGV